MKKNYGTILLGLLFSTSLINAQVLRRAMATGYSSPGAYSSYQSDLLSFAGNPASLAGLKKTSVAMYTEKRFLLNELSYYSILLGQPVSSGAVGLKTGYFGFSGYNETYAALAYGRTLGQKVNAGVQFNYYGVSISSGYGNSTAISGEIGCVLHLSDRLHTGIHIVNPGGGKFGKDRQEKISSVYSFGMGYDGSPQFFIGAEIEKEESRPVNIKAGFQYQFLSRVVLRAGILTATSTEWAGLGLLLNFFRLDLTVSYHPQFGVSPGLLLLFQFKKKEK